MKVQHLEIKGLALISPAVFGDDRGYFMESFSQKKMEEAGVNTHFVQDNESLSKKGVLRGLHFQAPPHAQAKLVRVVRGSVWDVVVDIRKNSPTFGKHFGVCLSAENKQMLYIPAGFAHGFLTLEDETIFQYKCSDFYYPETEGGIMWNDPDLKIDWPESEIQVSEKDKNNVSFQVFKSPFTYA